MKLLLIELSELAWHTVKIVGACIGLSLLTCIVFVVAWNYVAAPALNLNAISFWQGLIANFAFNFYKFFNYQNLTTPIIETFQSPPVEE